MFYNPPKAKKACKNIKMTKIKSQINAADI